MRHLILSPILLLALGARAQFSTDHFVDSWTLQPFENVRDVRTFDVENDGDQDVFVNRFAYFSGGTLLWYRNNGSGVFAPAVTINSGANFTEDFDLGDLDGDGDLDLVYTSYSGGNIYVRLFEAGAFGAPQIWGNSGSWARYVRCMQLDPLDNNLVDIVVHNENPLPSAMLNTGGAFGPATLIGNNSSYLGPDAMQVGNITGNLGDVLTYGGSHLWLHTLLHDNTGYYWVTNDLGYCDDRIQVVDVDETSYDGGPMEIGRTNGDTLYYTDAYYYPGDVENPPYFYSYTDIIDIGNAGYGTFGHADCDQPIDLLVDYSNDGEQVPLIRHGYYPDGFDFDLPTQATVLPLNGSWPVLVDLDEDGLNDLLRVETGTSLHWYTNDGLEPPAVSILPFQDTLVAGGNADCFGEYPLPDGLPAGGYWTGDGTDGPYFYSGFIVGDIPLTYNYDDNNGCHGSDTEILHVIDHVETIPETLSVCPSNTPYQLGSVPANAFWLSDNYVTPGGLLDISYPYQTTISCFWTDVTGCSVYGYLPVEVRETSYGSAYILGWEGPDILCTNSGAVTIRRSLATGGYEDIPFDPAAMGEGTYQFIGEADETIQVGCFVNDTLFLQVLPPPVVSLDPFLDTLANTCYSGYVLQNGNPGGPYDYYEGTNVHYDGDAGAYVFDAFSLVGDIPITYTYYDPYSGCSNSATQPITVIDSVVIVPDPIVTCPSPDPIQVLTYPNAVFGSNEVANGIVDVSYAHQQHYLCYWTDVVGCGVYGELNVNVIDPNYGYAYASCECTDLCTNGDPVIIYRSLPDGTEDQIPFDPAAQGEGYYYYVGYGYDNGPLSCPVNDTLFLHVSQPQSVSLDPVLDTLVNSCFGGYPLPVGTPSGGYYDGPGVDEPSFYPYGELGQVPITYYYYDQGSGCTNSATQYITVIDQVTTIPPSLVTCPSDVPYQLASVPANATWYADGTTNASGLVDISQPIYTYAYAYWTDVLGCEAQGETEINVQDVSYGQAYIYGWEGPDILCTNSDPVDIYVSRADGGYDLIPFDPATAGIGTYTFIGIAEDNGQYQCFENDTLFLQVLDPPVVTLAPFLDTLANTCDSGYPLTGGAPTDGYNYWSGTGVQYFTGNEYVFNALGLEGQIPVTYIHYDNLTGCSNSATQPITVIDSVVVVPDSIVTCPSPDPIQVLTYPNAVWGSNEVPNGVVDVSFPHQQHYLCYWTDIMGCGVYGALAVNVVYPDEGYAYTSCECSTICSNSDPITVYTSQPDGSQASTILDPAVSGLGTFMYVGYGYTGNDPSCPLNDTLYITVTTPPVVTLDPFLDTLANTCNSGYVLQNGSPNDSYNYYEGTNVHYDGNVNAYVFDALDLEGNIPVTYTYYDPNTGCSNSATQPITVIDSVVVVPDSIVTCPSPDPIQVLTYPNAVWGSNEVPNGLVDVSFPHQQHYLCYWTDVVGCGVYGALAVNVYDFTYGSVQVVGYDEPVSLCVNTPPVTVLVSQPDGSVQQQTFDPSQGAGTYDFTGVGPSAANCPADHTLTITVNDIPDVTLAPITDTLVSGCSGGYVLTGGLPAGGYYDGPGVDGDFYPFAQSGQVPITYQYTDGNGCAAYATQDITVIDQITAIPQFVESCPDGDPVQLASVPPGAVWSGNPFVTPGGYLDVSSPNNIPAIGTWTDVIGCATQVTVPVTVYDFIYGTVEVVGYDEPVSLCTNTPPVTVNFSIPDGTILSNQFDPSQGAGSYDFIGYGPAFAACPVNDTLTITVNDIPNVTLAPFTDLLANSCANGYALSGGLPAGGAYSGTGVNGDFFAQGLSGQVDITYTYADVNGCTSSATQPITVIDQITSDPDVVTTCPDTAPVQLTSTPSGAVWGGSQYVSAGGLLDVSTPNNEAAIGSWTDVVGCSLDVTVPVTVYDYTYGTVEVVGYNEPVALCANTPPVTVLISQADGSVQSVTFDPAANPGQTTFTGIAPSTADCPVNTDLTITVNPAPDVTLAPFTDLLANSCANGYALSGGLPAGGAYSGTGVNGDFFAQGLSGQVDITYTYADINGCTSSATQPITVIDQITSDPDVVTTCPDTAPVQLTSSQSGAVWGGSQYVSAGGLLDVSTPNNEAAIGSWTDVVGCSLDVTVPVTVYDYTYGTVEVVGYNEPVALCANTPPVTVLISQADGSVQSVTFDPAANPGQTTFTGIAPSTADCPVNTDLTITVNPAPDVTLAPFTDTLANACPDGYALTGGLPADGTYSGSGVNGDFFPEGLLGDIDITYTYQDGNGCSGSATAAITVIGALNATPTSIETCPGPDPIQLYSDLPGTVWGGSANVTPGGLVDLSSPFTADIIGTWTDANGCDLQATVPVTVNALTNGYAYVQGIPEPVTLCQDHDAVTIIRSLATGGEETITFDPSTQTPGPHSFTGFALASASCPVDYVLTIEVVASPTVSLALPYDELCTGSTVQLSGGLPAGGTYVNYSGTGGIMDIVDGPNAATYQYTDVSGCSGTSMDQIIGFSVAEANGYDTATPDLCPDSDPLIFQPTPPTGTWGGVLTGPEFDPATDAPGSWSYTMTDDAGGTCGMGGTLVVLPFTAATLETSLTTACVSGGPVQVFGTNALGGTINGPLTLDDPFDPFNPAGTFDPSVGTGDYVFSMDVAGDAQSCAWSLEVTVTVVAEPNVTVNTFTDTLLNICATSVYTLTQGQPAGGNWSGPGVSDNTFSPFGLSGPQTLTYTFDAGPGCQGSATGVIEVVSEVTAFPYNSQTPLYACEDSDPVQLGTVPGGSVWSGDAVTPTGYVGMADPFSGILSYVFTDAADCQFGAEMQAIISPWSYGSVVIGPPGATIVCLNNDAFDITLSTAQGTDSVYHFDPLIEGVDIHPFTGVAPLQTDPPGCYQDYVLTVQVVDSAILDLPTDWLDPDSAVITLSGGAPANGAYSGPGVIDGTFDPALANAGWNVITYTAGPCSATDSILVSPVGINEVEPMGTLTIWPVPTRDELFISLPAGVHDVFLTLVDASGREVAHRAVSHDAAGTPLRWDIGSLASGTYTLWTTGTGAIAPARVVITH